MDASRNDVTQLLVAWSDGDASALEKLTPIVYAELHRLASGYMAGERHEVTLQATALVNELYLRLVDTKQMQWQNRAHFFGVSAQLMRHILVDFARARRSLKRGGDAIRLSLDESLDVSGDYGGADLVDLDEALHELAKADPRKVQVIELRFFGGLSIEESAAVLNVSPDTVMRDWRLAKAWLHRELSNTSG